MNEVIKQHAIKRVAEAQSKERIYFWMRVIHVCERKKGETYV